MNRVFPRRAPCAMALWKTCVWVRKRTLVQLSIVGNSNLPIVRKAHASPPTSGSRPTTPPRDGHHPCAAAAPRRLGADMIDIASGCAKRTYKSNFWRNRCVNHHYLPDLHAGQIIVSKGRPHADDHLAEPRPSRGRERLRAPAPGRRRYPRGSGYGQRRSRHDLAQQGRIGLSGKFVADEAAQRQAFRQNRRMVPGRPSVPSPGDAVILRDQATDLDARARLSKRQHRLPDRAADILEVHIHPV